MGRGDAVTGAELAQSPTRLEFLRSVQTRATEHARADWRPPR